tara:strand:+ start:53 stop:586 length:534 start_codon:yes stop_codon:yes gene_type:complete
MYHKNKRSTKKKKIKFQKTFSNLLIITLTILIVGFIYSGLNRLMFNNDIITEYQDLSTLITKSSFEKKTGHKIQIEIWNGCGISNLALMYTNYLRNEGIDVLDSKNADHFDYLQTKIIYHRDNIEVAENLASILQIDPSNILENKNETLFYDLTLIIGKDYMSLPSYKDAVIYQPPF